MLEKAKATTYRFFREPMEEKKKYSKENSATSHVRYNTSFLPQIEKALEWKVHLSRMFYVFDEETTQYWPPYRQLGWPLNKYKNPSSPRSESEFIKAAFLILER
nr:feruloyl CoA ortho-hydroxylase 1-like [Ipomoea trifida]